MLFCYMPDFTWNKTTKRKKKKLSDSHCNFTSVMLCKFCTLLPPKPPIRFNDCRSVMPLVFLLSLSLVLLFSLIVSLCDYFNARTHFAVLSSYLLYDRAFTHYLLTPKLVWANFFVSFVFIVIRILCVFVLFSLNSLSLSLFLSVNQFLSVNYCSRRCGLLRSYRPEIIQLGFFCCLVVKIEKKSRTMFG